MSKLLTFRCLKPVYVTPMKNLTNMCAADLLRPPCATHLKTLDKKLFTKQIKVPSLRFKQENLDKVRLLLKPIMLKIPKLKPLIVGPESAVLLNPNSVQHWDDINEKIRNTLLDVGVSKDNLSFTEIELNYDNWNADDILKAILPQGVEIARSFSKVGHIIHLNLRDHLLDYKQIIGEVLLDKTPNSKTVVNKTANIDNTYRNFSMELICGEDLMITQVKENGITYEFDFSKVYWNPRLSTEHQRVTDGLSAGDVLFDVFCGVGPFAIPAAKKKVKVFANDLNPESYKWLNRSIKLNKINSDLIKTFNKDGKDFIRTEMKENLMTLSNDKLFAGKVHVTMNLPALALDFVQYFKHLFEASESATVILPTIHVYFFVHGDTPEFSARVDFEKCTGLDMNDLSASYQFVRNVSPKKDMVKISFLPPLSFLLEDSEPKAKRFCGDP